MLIHVTAHESFGERSKLACYHTQKSEQCGRDYATESRTDEPFAPFAHYLSLVKVTELEPNRPPGHIAELLGCSGIYAADLAEHEIFRLLEEEVLGQIR